MEIIAQKNGTGSQHRQHHQHAARLAKEYEQDEQPEPAHNGQTGCDAIHPVDQVERIDERHEPNHRDNQIQPQRHRPAEKFPESHTQPIGHARDEHLSRQFLERFQFPFIVQNAQQQIESADGDKITGPAPVQTALCSAPRNQQKQGGPSQKSRKNGQSADFGNRVDMNVPFPRPIQQPTPPRAPPQHRQCQPANCAGHRENGRIFQEAHNCEGINHPTVIFCDDFPEVNFDTSSK